MIRRIIYDIAKRLNDLQDYFTVGRLDQIPKFSLEEKHVRNCKVLPNRIAMLHLLSKSGTIAELGVAKGNFSMEILKCNIPQKLFLIDSWPANSRYKGLENLVVERFRNEIQNQIVEIRKGNSVEVLSEFPNGYFDWIYIDTVHDYKTTKAELEIASYKVKTGGLICGDDYAVRSYRYGVKYGVIEAVHEFCVNNGWEFIFLTAQSNGHNNFALKQIL